MVNSRKYREPISLICNAISDDAYGKKIIGNAESTYYTYAEVKQSNQSRVMYENSGAVQTAITFTIRYTDFKFNKVLWKGKEYIVNSVNNLNQRNRELVIYTNRAE